MINFSGYIIYKINVFSLKYKQNEKKIHFYEFSQPVGATFQLDTIINVLYPRRENMYDTVCLFLILIQ